MNRVAVALVEPQYHVNVGHVARLMKNFGHSKLYLIKPSFDAAEAARYATHGKNVLAAAKVTTLKQLRKRHNVIIGTTAIRASSRLNVLRESVSPQQVAQIIDAGPGKSFCIVLGRESSGMTNSELALCDLICTISTRTNYATMNIAHALAIVLYEISKLDQAHDSTARPAKKRISPASQRDINILLQYLDRVSRASNYDEHKRPLLAIAVKKMLAKSAPAEKDVMLLVSLFRKSWLAINRKQKRATERARFKSS